MITHSLKWTTRDLGALPNDGGLRHEIIEGDLFVTRAPHIRHQGVAAKLQTRLEIWSEATGLGHAFQTPGLVFTEYDAVIPDLVWASRECLDRSIDAAGHFTAAPELVVEVLSAGEQNEQRDKEIKLKLYSCYGVHEYWIADWQRQTLAIYRRQETQLALVATLMLGDTLTSPLLPGFSASVTEIFSL
jgi:Uma2 family endonuclease